MYKLTVLKNKLKIITHSMPNVHSVTAGIFVGAGSRFESDDIAGISHFAEHMFFKGTSRRPTAADVSRAVEGIGGYTNAATSQDYTFFYTRVPTKHSAFSLEFLSDLINNSLFDASAIKREKGVILEELNMYLDTPTRYIYDLIMQALWPAHPLGRDVIGNKQSILRMNRQKFLQYLKTTYQPQNMVVSLAGKVNHGQVVKQVKKYFEHNKISNLKKFNPVKTTQKKPHLLLHSKQTDQVHLALAVPGLPRGHKDELTLNLLDTLLGTGMSSRLFLNIREKRGLCYYISSFTEKFADTGIFGITAGLNTAKIELAVKAIVAEIDSLAKIKVSPAELNRAKEYLRGTLSLQMDNTDNMAIYYGFQALFNKKVEPLELRIKKLLQVTENDIIKLAAKLFNKNRLNLAIIGPFKQKDKNKFYKLITN